ATSYRLQLQQRQAELAKAREQVESSANDARVVLKRHFGRLREELGRQLEARLAVLLVEVNNLERSACHPLDKCQELLQQKVDAVADLMTQGEAALQVHSSTTEKLLDLRDAAARVHLGSLPEVPSLNDVPCLSANLPRHVIPGLELHLSTHGAVAAQPPVRIEDIVERPGALHLRWTKVDEDYPVDEYVVQCSEMLDGQQAQGSVGDNVSILYRGPKCEFTAVRLVCGTRYSFRAGIRCSENDVDDDATVWSVPQVGSTSLPSHEWSVGHLGFTLNRQRDMALRNAITDASVLYSRSASYHCGQSIAFRVECAGQSCRMDSIGLCMELLPDTKTLRRCGALCIGSSGAVFVNGKEMTNQLPPLAAGMTVTFETEPVLGHGGDFRLRVSVACGEREVVSDWPLQQPQLKLFFGCSFLHAVHQQMPCDIPQPQLRRTPTEHCHRWSGHDCALTTEAFHLFSRSVSDNSQMTLGLYGFM
uniref:cytokine receptor-like factor 3 n=1 Tax=Myxine glutinosa TaxID=7769 RepID=UPI00358E8750